MNILTLGKGERFYLKIYNTGSKTVDVSIFNICAESATLVSYGCHIGQ